MLIHVLHKSSHFSMSRQIFFFSWRNWRAELIYRIKQVAKYEIIHMHGNTNYFKYPCFASHLAHRKGLWQTRQTELSCSNSTAFFMTSQGIIYRSLVLGCAPESAARRTTSTWSAGRVNQGPALSTSQHSDKNAADGKATTAASQPDHSASIHY